MSLVNENSVEDDFFKSIDEPNDTKLLLSLIASGGRLSGSLKVFLSASVSLFVGAPFIKGGSYLEDPSLAQR